MEKEYLDALTSLQKTSSSGEGSVFDHLTEVVKKVRERQTFSTQRLAHIAFMCAMSATHAESSMCAYVFVHVITDTSRLDRYAHRFSRRSPTALSICWRPLFS